MADIINIGRSVRDLRKSPIFPEISAIRMIVDDNTEYSAGTNTGYTWEIESPWATQAQANWLLTKMQGLSYQPYEADAGQLPPEAELGDYLNIRGLFGGLFSEEILFGKNYTANFAAPDDQDVDHEFTFEDKTERRINQKVSKKSPSGNTTFGWSLQDDGWRVFNEDGNVFTISATGAWLKGNFEIVGGSIVLRKSDNTQAFTVDEDGNVSITGSLTLQGTEITASKLRTGAVNGYDWQHDSYGSTTKAGYSLTGGGYGYNYNSATQSSGGSYPSYFRASYLNASDTFAFAGYAAEWRQLTINGSTYRFLIAET